MKTISKITTALAVAGLLAAGVIIIKNKKESLSKTPSMKSYAMIISSIKPKTQEVSLSLPYLAVIESDKNVALSSRISARIEKIIKCGSKIRKGEVLVKLDDSELKEKINSINLQILSIKAEIVAKENLLNISKASHKRTKELLTVKGASQELYDKEQANIISLNAIITSLKNQINILKSSISQIETSLSYTTLTSPIDGIASQCFANIGDISKPAKPLLNLESKNGKYLLIRSSDDIKPKAVKFEGIEYPLLAMQSTFNGLNEYRAYIQTTRSTGERVNISLITYKESGLKLPINALLQKDSKTYCFVINKNKADAVELRIIAEGDEGVVVSGLKDGAEVVIAKPDILLKILAGVSIVVEK